MLGLDGLILDSAIDVGRVLDQALASDRPCIIDAKVDPDVVALPPHSTWEQTKKFFLALAKGDEDRKGIIEQLLKQWRS